MYGRMESGEGDSVMATYSVEFETVAKGIDLRMSLGEARNLLEFIDYNRSLAHDGPVTAALREALANSQDDPTQ